MILFAFKKLLLEDVSLFVIRSLWGYYSFVNILHIYLVFFLITKKKFLFYTNFLFVF